jgi:hypothetical protein
MYTAPAYFMNLIVTGTIICMVLFFRDRVRIKAPKNTKQKSAKRTAIEDAANNMTFVGLTVYDCCILGCMLLNVSTKGSISAFETLGVSIAESHFDMASSRAGVIVASCGSIGVIALLSMGHLAKFLTDIQLICGGMLIMSFGVLSLGFLEQDSVNPSWKFCTAIFLIYSVGYPIGHTAVIGLFSKSEFPRSSFRFFRSCFSLFSTKSYHMFLPPINNIACSSYYHSISFPHSLTNSRRKEATRNTIGLVCISGIPCTIVFSHYVRLRNKLLRYFSTILCVDLRVNCVHSDYHVQP